MKEQNIKCPKCEKPISVKFATLRESGQGCFYCDSCGNLAVVDTEDLVAEYLFRKNQNWNRMELAEYLQTCSCGGHYVNEYLTCEHCGTDINLRELYAEPTLAPYSGELKTTDLWGDNIRDLLQDISKTVERVFMPGAEARDLRYFGSLELELICRLAPDKGFEYLFRALSLDSRRGVSFFKVTIQDTSAKTELFFEKGGRRVNSHTQYDLLASMLKRLREVWGEEKLLGKLRERKECDERTLAFLTAAMRKGPRPYEVYDPAIYPTPESLLADMNRSGKRFQLVSASEEVL